MLDAAAEFAGAKGRRVTFEYACIAGVNDSPDQAEALGRLLGAFPGAGGAHVNLIPLNPTAGSAATRPHRRRSGPSPTGCARHGRDRHGPAQPGHRHRRRVRAAPLPGRRCPVRVTPDRQQWRRERRKWVNQFQPQTLYIATILCYIDAVFGLIFSASPFLPASLIADRRSAAGGFGIANEKKWGYAVAVGRRGPPGRAALRGLRHRRVHAPR